ncbi:MAG TPA: RHS repeat-associated core domain-containing protein, partial [Pyrinomonadaceae bacterium]|nr:RHS repeat-associated core domain-containing protein [Pyrinomonadaceae bacterium]
TLSRTGWGGTNPQYGASYTNNKMNGMTYDNAGNLTDAGGGWTFTYDATGQQETSAMGNVQMFYDGDRLRGKKSENGAVTYYLRSSVLGGQVVAEVTSGVGWSRGYVYLGGQLLAVQQGGVYWMHQDPFVKSKRVTDGSGNVVSVVELDPWGGETNRSSNEAFQPRKFTTYERDSIGSDDAMHRRYNRWWARFEQSDPYDGSYDMTDPQSFNRYSYVQNDPVNFVDPLGLDPQDPPQTPQDPDRPPPITHIDPATGLPYDVQPLPAENVTINISSDGRSASVGGTESGPMVIELPGPAQDPLNPGGGSNPENQFDVLKMVEESKKQQRLRKQAWDEYQDCVRNSSGAAEYRRGLQGIPQMDNPLIYLGIFTGRTIAARLLFGVNIISRLNVAGLVMTTLQWGVFSTAQYNAVEKRLYEKHLAPAMAECQSKVRQKYGFVPTFTAG